MVLENLPWMSMTGQPAIFGTIFAFIAAVAFKRPYIVIVAAILGILVGMGI